MTPEIAAEVQRLMAQMFEALVASGCHAGRAVEAALIAGATLLEPAGVALDTMLTVDANGSPL